MSTLSKNGSTVSSASISSSPVLQASRNSTPRRGPKFTRGEKCIFFHLIVTFSLILFLCLIYFIHLCVVNHSYREVLKISRRKTLNTPVVGSYPVGYLYLSSDTMRPLCNTVLLRERWSAAPGHCAAARTDPDMASFLPQWRIKYAKRDNTILKSKIKRTIPHPHFDKSDFRNNVGLFEHESSLNGVPHFDFSGTKAIDDNLMLQYANNAMLCGWAKSETNEEDAAEIRYVRNKVRPVADKSCAQFMSPILPIRKYEHCVILDRRDDLIPPNHGSVLVIDSNIMGFFAWGEKSGKAAPCIIVDLQHYRTWMENIIAW